MNSKKILFVASIPEHFKAFHLPYLKWFKDNGYETHVACNGYLDLPNVDFVWQVDIQRSPISIKNLNAYKQLKNVIDSNNYSLINCHTPVASVITRLASRDSRNKGTKVLYTAHGFHFFKGASKFFWLTFYPIEILLSKYCDAIITINKEDFNLISKKGSDKTDYYIINGIGVDSKRFFKVTSDKKNKYRIDKNISEDKIVLIYAAEFIKRKDHQFIIDSVNKERKIFENIEILFAGRGLLEDELKKQVNDKELYNIIKFLGFRKDIDELFKASDIILSSSSQEGLPINVIEGMFSGLPVIATDIRGHSDLIEPGVNGFLFERGNFSTFFESIKLIKQDRSLIIKFGNASLEKAQKYEITNTLIEMTNIYKYYL